MKDALNLVRRILASPPARLSALEALLGPLHVDFAGGEGMGSFYRPGFTPSAASVPLPRGLSSLAVRFGWARHHEEPTRRRELYLSSVDYQLDAPQEALERILGRSLGRGRDLVHPERRERWREHGSFYVLTDPGSLAVLRWEATRPEWALPPIDPGPRVALLEALVAALHTETTEPAVLARLGAHLAPCGVQASHPIMFSPDGRQSSISLLFQPALSLRMLLDALGWPEAIAYPGSVHKDSWTVLPDAGHAATQANVAEWVVHPELARWPRGPGGAELPEAGGWGPSPKLVLAGCVTDVGSIQIVPASVYR
jgi:hypothetical protein